MNHLYIDDDILSAATLRADSHTPNRGYALVHLTHLHQYALDLSNDAVKWMDSGDPRMHAIRAVSCAAWAVLEYIETGIYPAKLMDTVREQEAKAIAVEPALATRQRTVWAKYIKDLRACKLS